jgi:hypothetical protein
MLSCSCTSLGDVSNPAFYIPLIPILYVFCAMIYHNNSPSPVENGSSAIRSPKSPIAWLYLRTLSGARAWLVFYLFLAVLELWESYCILRMMLNLCWHYWSWSVPGAPWGLKMMKQIVILQVFTVFGIVLMICVMLFCFKVAAIGALREWMLDTHEAEEDSESYTGEKKRS